MVRTIRLMFRIMRMAATIYGVGTAVSKSPWLRAVTSILFSALKRRWLPTRVVSLRLVTSRDPAIYRRIGWRRMSKDNVV